MAHVSRETLERLGAYADLLGKWQNTVNLVAPSTLPDLWRRHMLDSAQLAPRLREESRSPPTVADLGSGAGFPGLVLAVVTGFPMLLVEADARKCAFLREAVRVTEAPASVLNARIEALAPGEAVADIVVARAVAPLEDLCFLAGFLHPRCCLFLKGRNWRRELTAARKRWTMQVESFASLSAPSARVLRLRGIAPLAGGPAPEAGGSRGAAD